MKEVQMMERFEQAEALLKPQRVEVLRQLGEPRSCTEVAERLDQTPQWVYYHVKRLVEAGLVTQVSQRPVRGIQEGVYQANARSYWLSPELLGRIDARGVRDELSLGYLLDLLQDVQSDVASIAAAAGTEVEIDLPSIAVSGEIRVPPHRRQEFVADLRTMMQDLFTRYGGADGDAFKVAVACYPAFPKETPV
ncbi:ArsR/SmtB family transcription factor [Rhizohabitans arisaemae]|uniref:ArsR/SmtB family transcription factor n=1 Tax=Rhizohabitans arisaemae TaxID=2720610 RepID=UPI0024B04635|nr:helix-turn-helix domain-containing protein [Rhizohabitans arisaemae]